MDIVPIPAFNDNYFWLLVQGTRAAIVDPGAAAPVEAALQQRGLALAAILVTHHHGDHVGGVAALAQAHRAPVYGPRNEDIPCRDVALAAGDTARVLDVDFTVLDVPGHTRGHIAYHAPALAAVFCGDTLFAGGCGRLFEGTPGQMVDSLAQLAALPADTRVYCAHEYTLSNLRFARACEPGNAALAEREARCQAQRARGEPTVPSTIAEERATNPFLRCDQPALRAAARTHDANAGRTTVDTFAALRAWKNQF